MNWERQQIRPQKPEFPGRSDGQHFDLNTICNRTLPKVAQHIGMQQNVHIYLIRNDKTKTFYGIKPFNCSSKRQTAINSVSGHVYLSNFKLNNFKYLILNCYIVN